MVSQPGGASTCMKAIKLYLYLSSFVCMSFYSARLLAETTERDLTLIASSINAKTITRAFQIPVDFGFEYYSRFGDHLSLGGGYHYFSDQYMTGGGGGTTNDEGIFNTFVVEEELRMHRFLSKVRHADASGFYAAGGLSLAYYEGAVTYDYSGRSDEMGRFRGYGVLAESGLGHLWEVSSDFRVGAEWVSVASVLYASSPEVISDGIVRKIHGSISSHAYSSLDHPSIRFLRLQFRWSL